VPIVNDQPGEARPTLGRACCAQVSDGLGHPPGEGGSQATRRQDPANAIAAPVGGRQRVDRPAPGNGGLGVPRPGEDAPPRVVGSDDLAPSPRGQARCLTRRAGALGCRGTAESDRLTLSMGGTPGANQGAQFCASVRVVLCASPGGRMVPGLQRDCRASVCNAKLNVAHRDGCGAG
jgi:hypothetical protein